MKAIQDFYLKLFLMWVKMVMKAQPNLKPIMDM